MDWDDGRAGVVVKDSGNAQALAVQMLAYMAAKETVSLRVGVQWTMREPAGDVRRMVMRLLAPPLTGKSSTRFSQKSGAPEPEVGKNRLPVFHFKGRKKVRTQRASHAGKSVFPCRPEADPASARFTAVSKPVF